MNIDDAWGDADVCILVQSSVNMSLVPSLLNAILRLDGEAMVMHVGEKPYVVAGTRHVDLATRALTFQAVSGMVGQLLPIELQRALDEFGAVQYEFPRSAEFAREHFSVVAARGGEDVWVEVRRRRIPDEDRIPDDIFALAAAAVPAAARVDASAADDERERYALPQPSQLFPDRVEPRHDLSALRVDDDATWNKYPENEAVADPETREPVVPTMADAEPAIDVFAEPEPAVATLHDPDSIVATVHEPDSIVATLHEPDSIVTTFVAPEPVEPCIEEQPAPVAPAPLDVPVMAADVAHGETDPDVMAAPEDEEPSSDEDEHQGPDDQPAIIAPPYEPPAVTAPPAHVEIEPSIAPQPEEPAWHELEIQIPENEPPIVASSPDAPPIVATTPVPSAPEPNVTEYRDDEQTWQEFEMPISEQDAPVVPAATDAPMLLEGAAIASTPLAAATGTNRPATPPSSQRRVGFDFAPSLREPAPIAAADAAPPAEIPAAAAAIVGGEPADAIPDASAPEPRAAAAASEPTPMATVEEPEPVTPAEAAEVVVAPPPVRLIETAAAPSQPAVVVPLARGPIRAEAQPPAVAGPSSGLDRLLRTAAARAASTLYLTAGTRPALRVDREIQTLSTEPVLSTGEVESLLIDLMPERNREELRHGMTTEWICDLAGVGRVRCMTFRDHRGAGGIFRMMPLQAISADQLGLSREIQALAAEPEGLVLFAGPRSSGKSTLSSAFVDLINRSRRDHVITIESEIKVVHEQRRSLVSQREVRGSVDEMVAVARAALREDPDVLVIEDLCSPGLVSVALDAAASGRFVIAALPAHTATGAIDRIIDLYPPDERRRVQLALAETLRGVVAQVLVRKPAGGRIAAREVLLNTPAVASVIAEGKTSQLPLAIEGGRKHGMMPLNDALAALVQRGVVEADEAYRRAADRQAFVVALKRQNLDTSFVERLA